MRCRPRESHTEEGSTWARQMCLQEDKKGVMTVRWEKECLWLPALIFLLPSFSEFFLSFLPSFFPSLLLSLMSFPHWFSLSVPLPLNTFPGLHCHFWNYFQLIIITWVKPKPKKFLQGLWDVAPWHSWPSLLQLILSCYLAPGNHINLLPFTKNARPPLSLDFAGPAVPNGSTLLCYCNLSSTPL